MKVIVTGSTGFIGRNLVRAALDAGHGVGVLLRPDSAPDLLPDDTRIRRFVIQDMKDSWPDIDALRQWEPDVLVHAAWRGISSGERDAAYQMTWNLPCTLRSVEFARRTGVRHWIGLGSQAEYGPMNGAVAENTPANPVTLYGKAKLATGIAALGLCDAWRITGSWLRIFSVYGPGDAPDHLIPYLARQFVMGRVASLTRCAQRWDFLHIHDATQAILAVAETGAAGVFNLGSGKAPPLRETVETMRHLVAGAPPPDYGAIPDQAHQGAHLQADVSRLRHDTGWTPSIELESGFRMVIAEIEEELNSLESRHSPT